MLGRHVMRRGGLVFPLGLGDCEQGVAIGEGLVGDFGDFLREFTH
jgi:hypothetical protein